MQWSLVPYMHFFIYCTESTFESQCKTQNSYGFKKEDKHIKLLVLSIFKQLLIHFYILNFNLKFFLEIKGLNLMDIILVGFLHHFAVHFVEYMAFDLVAAHSLQDLSAHIADLATIEVDVAHDDVYFEMQSV